MERVSSISQAYSQAPWRKQLQIIGLFLLLVVFVALIAGIYLNVTARAATLGREILIMQSQIQKLELEIADLETRLAIANSGQEMQDRALALGFHPIEKDELTFIAVPGYSPRWGAVMAPAPEPVEIVSASLPADYTESLFDWIIRRAQIQFGRLEVLP